MTAVTMAYVALFIASAATDVLELRIPNAFVAALILLFAWVCVVDPPKSIFWVHVAPAVVVFALAAIPFFFNKFGGGDVKLLAVAVLWVGLPSLGVFFILLAVYGLIALFVFAVLRMQVVAALAWTGARLGRAIPVPASLQTGKSIPYGVVIAAAALTIGPGLTRGVT
jgi:Flp pilus assembly protein protease CpaA